MYTATFEPVLGTRLRLRINRDRPMTPAATEAIDARVLVAADHLEGVLSAYNEASAWSRWRRGETVADDDAVHIAAVLAAAQRWHDVGGGAFHPAISRLMGRWSRAETEQRVPDRLEMSGYAATDRDLPFLVDDKGVLHRLGDCRELDHHALAKGYVVDQLASLLAADFTDVMVELGGDLRHMSRDSSIVVGIEDPTRTADNAAPLTRVRVRNAALASSAGTRRGWRIEGQWFGHQLDPRTGWPLPSRAHASVIAPTAIDADAAATAIAVLGPDDGLVLANSLGLAALVLDDEGRAASNGAWRDAEAAV